MTAMGLFLSPVAGMDLPDYVGPLLLKPQGVSFGNGTDRHFHAVITNEKTGGGRLTDHVVR